MADGRSEIRATRGSAPRVSTSGRTKAPDEEFLAAATALLDAYAAEALLLSSDGVPLLANEPLCDRLGEQPLWNLSFEDEDASESIAIAALLDLANLDGTFVRRLRIVAGQSPGEPVELRLLPVRAFADFPGGWLLSIRPRTAGDAPPRDDLESLRRCRAALVEALRHPTGGEVVVRSGDIVGRIFVHRGDIAWAYSTAMKGTLLQALEREGLDPKAIRSAFDQCRVSGRNFGEELVRLGMLDRVRMREVLRLHVRERLRSIVSLPDANVLFAPADRAYQSDFTFSLRELLE